MDKIIDPKGFEAFVSKAFNLTPEEVASLYNEAGELTDFTLLHNRHTDRVSKTNTDTKNQYSRGLKEAALKLEKELKEKYEVESDLIGVELIDHIIETKLADVKKDDTDIMKHPEVIRLINAQGKEIKKINKEWEDKLAAKEAEIKYDSVFSKVKAQAMAEFQNMNPILPGDANKAQRLSEVLISDLSKFRFSEEKDGFIVLDATGENHKDDYGRPVSFSDLVKSTAEKYFDFKKAEDRSSSGNTNGTGASTGKIRKPKDKADYISMMQDNSLTPEERVGITKLYKTTQ